jgi:hypothetical protein
MNTEILLGAIGALSAAIAFLYRRQIATLDRIESKLDACEADRAMLWERIVKIESNR